MKLNLIESTYEKISGSARPRLAFHNEPFFFANAYDKQNGIYMNESIPNKEEIIKAVRTMWACPVVDRTDETEEILDKAYNFIAALAGKEAANQINSIWCDMAKVEGQRIAIEEAQVFLETIYEPMNESIEDDMWKAGYQERIATDGLWQALNQSGDKNYLEHSRHATAVYGFYLGMRYAKQNGV